MVVAGAALLSGCGRSEPAHAGSADTTDSETSSDDGSPPGTTTDAPSTSATSLPSTTATTDSTSTGPWDTDSSSSTDPGSTTTGSDDTTTTTGGFCGDGSVDPGEECDDANADETDDCLSTCQAASCGDGFVQAGVEECDDADTDDLDRCHDDCSWHRVTQLGVGPNHTCALFDSGNVKCWGNGHHGRTGHGDEIDIGDDEPASAAGFLDLGAPAVQLVIGIAHVCVIHDDGALRCFGRNLEGQLGYGNIANIGDDELPSAVGPVPVGGNVAHVHSGSGAFHTCAWLDSGSARCWGPAANGKLGLPGLLEDLGDDEPASTGGPLDIGGTVSAFALDGDGTTAGGHSCALLDDGTVRCWGNGSQGALGYGNAATLGDDETPASAGAVPVGALVTQLTTGWFHTCARTDSGGVRCWGRGNNGALGYGNTLSVGVSNTPADVGDVDIGGVAVDIAAGAAHTCALLDDQSVRCWGGGAQGALGYGNTASIGDDELPFTAGPVDVGAPVVDIEAGFQSTCVITDTGAVRCWGQPGDGRLGYGNLAMIGDDETPAEVGDVPLLP